MFENARDKRINGVLVACVAFAVGLQVVFNVRMWSTVSAAGRPMVDIKCLIVAAFISIALAWLVVRFTFARLDKMQNSKLGRFYELLRHDALTGALNRTFFLDQIRSDAVDGTLLAIDVDHFKIINDEYGHYTGDAALAHLAAVMAKAIKGQGFLGRLGGEEFAVFFPECPFHQGLVHAENLRQAVAAAALNVDDETISLTVSVGAAFHQHLSPVGTTLRVADDRLYAAKKLGRNRVASCKANGILSYSSKRKTAKMKAVAS